MSVIETTRTAALIAEGYVKNLKQTKKIVTLRESASAEATTIRRCLPADAVGVASISAGERYLVTAAHSTFCDPRGWSCDNWKTASGPEGLAGYYVKGSLGYPLSPIGALIGAISAHDPGPEFNPEDAAIIFASPFHIGTFRDAHSPINGRLWLIFNDTWTWGDNKGSVEVSLTFF